MVKTRTNTKRGLASGERWAIVLAGGEGRRLSPLTLLRFGEHRPKQYCAFLGRRSMFEHTMSRAVSLVGGQRVVTVIGRGHMRFLDSRESLSGYLVEQPCDRDTAAGIFLPLTYVLAYDPEATVAIFPSDHFVNPNLAFLRCMERALELAERPSGWVVLASAVADRPEVEYGWIQSGEPAPEADGLGARRVLQFHEKPDARRAAEFLSAGFFWNTFNMAVKAKALWELGRERQPELVERFERLRRAIGSAEEARALAEIYEDMPRVNFSKGLLERCAERTLALPMTGVQWSDWGRPERIEATLASLARPAAAALSPAPAPSLIRA